MSQSPRNDRLLRALRLEPNDRPPVWLMRQAGRYLPEYQKTRAMAGDFMALCRNPELACEVTLQPLRRFELDAAILFCDILVIPDAMGQGLSFVSGEGPRFDRTVRQMADVEQLREYDTDAALDYALETVHNIQQHLDGEIPLIGFAGSPWTLAAYMIEGGSSRDFKTSKGLLLNQPGVAHALLQRLTDKVSEFLLAQIRAGVNAVQVFDSWGGVLTARQYLEFSLPYMKQIVERLRGEAEDTPVILFSKGANLHLPALADTGCAGLSVDWTVNLATARHMTGNRVALQGNLDPAALHVDKTTLQAEVRAVLEDFGEGPGHIFNLGHGITPDVPPEAVNWLTEAVHHYSS